MCSLTIYLVPSCASCLKCCGLKCLKCFSPSNPGLSWINPVRQEIKSTELLARVWNGLSFFFLLQVWLVFIKILIWAWKFILKMSINIWEYYPSPNSIMELWFHSIIRVGKLCTMECNELRFCSASWCRKKMHNEIMISLHKRRLKDDNTMEA